MCYLFNVFLSSFRNTHVFFGLFSKPGCKIAPNTGTNATKFLTLATKSWKLVPKLASRISNDTLPRDLVIVEDF